MLVSDRASCSPEIMQRIRSDIIEVLSKYVEVDIDGIDINITYIDLTDFDFSLGIPANCMFYGCHSLTEIIFPSTGKIKITNAGGMFGECKSLTSLNVLNFDVSSVNDFGNMFMDCE